MVLPKKVRLIRMNLYSFQFDLIQSCKEIRANLTNCLLRIFRNSDGWEVVVDGSIALIEWGVGKDINSMDISDPVVGFVFNNKALMYNLNLEGSNISLIVL